MKEKNSREVSVTLKIIDLKLLDFHVLSDLPKKFEKTGLDKNNIQFEFNLGIHVNPVKKRAHLDLSTNFYSDQEKKIHLGNLSSFGEFEILNLDEILKDYEGKIPNAVVSNLIGIVLSTTRGFYILKSIGTIMEGIMLPIIDINAFFPKPIASTT